jgi:hypothetical protein
MLKHRFGRFLATVAVAGLMLAIPQRAAADREFNHVVSSLAATLHARREHRFLFAMVDFVVWAAHPSGIRGFHMAMFKTPELPALGVGQSPLAPRIAASVRGPWQPVVRTWSSASQESALIFARPERHNLIRMLIVDVEAGESVVIEMTVSPLKLSQMVNDKAHPCGSGNGGCT